MSSRPVAIPIETRNRYEHSHRAREARECRDEPEEDEEERNEAPGAVAVREPSGDEHRGQRRERDAEQGEPELRVAGAGRALDRR